MKTFTIDRSRFNEKGQELYDLLVPIMPREDYIYYVMLLMKSDKDRQMVIDYIKNESNNWSDIITFVKLLSAYNDKEVWVKWYKILLA